MQNRLKMLNFEKGNEFNFVYFNKCAYYLRHIVQNYSFFYYISY